MSAANHCDQTALNEHGLAALRREGSAWRAIHWDWTGVVVGLIPLFY